MRPIAFALLATSLSACAPADAVDPRDLPIADREIPPAPTEGFQIVTPVVEIPAGEERFYCYYGTYRGPDVGVYRMVVHSDPDFSHHSLLKAPLPVEDADRADGDLVDCSSVEEQFPPRPTLLESVSLFDEVDDEDEDEALIDDWMEGEEWVNLTPDLAFRFDSGQRWLADIHFVNTSDELVRSRAVFDLHTEPQEAVENFVNTFNHDAGGFELPVGEVSTRTFACTWDHDVTILSIGGHMHSWGDRYRVDLAGPQGMIEENVYVVDQWTPDMRFVPVLDQYQPGEWTVHAGESFITSCTWNNTAGRPLSFPDEMCTTFGVAYPIDEAIYCIGQPEQPGPPN